MVLIRNIKTSYTRCISGLRKLNYFVSLSRYGWSHDYEQHIEDRGTSIVLYMASYAETTFISEEADQNIAYGTMEGEDKIILDGETEYTGMYYPAGGGMDGWSIKKTPEGYLVTGEGAIPTVLIPWEG